MLPTPTAYDWNKARKPETWEKAKKKHKEKGVNLQEGLKQKAANGMLPTPKAYQGMLPTPRASDVFGAMNPDHIENKNGTWVRISKTTGTKFGAKMSDVAPMLPTPTATDWKGAYSPKSINNNKARKRMMRNIYHKVQEDHQYHSKNSQLNPQFVEEMMGFPNGWTVLPFLNGEGKQ